MIFGKSTMDSIKKKCKEAKRNKEGVFAWKPVKLYGGKWCWLEYVHKEARSSIDSTTWYWFIGKQKG